MIESSLGCDYDREKIASIERPTSATTRRVVPYKYALEQRKIDGIEYAMQVNKLLNSTCNNLPESLEGKIMKRSLDTLQTETFLCRKFCWGLKPRFESLRS